MLVLGATGRALRIDDVVKRGNSHHQTLCNLRVDGPRVPPLEAVEAAPGLALEIIPRVLALAGSSNERELLTDLSARLRATWSTSFSSSSSILVQ